ncbi:Molybdopterin binding protein [Basidiobolus meristosporus CBS 931.73]|uniref:Molybdopterin binding protein n=1 Tax=Basidiobolus meristosporus CBS 931.73 TaxID=1314790 RepID=A0A1Y1Z5U8_9FUNG|nr:Molybdopterin binding protein [Basidiobolus meristosporus CBS 931.73]|eukprot:ORY05639.1 Molybdopterin binding protein [Basidiobolus meristosporus CBS 931.73]
MSTNTTTTGCIKTAAACIIGDEILSGKTRDTNTNFLAKYLFDLGIDLRRVEVIPDVEEDIVETVTRLSRKFDVVFTSGGIGPTHDDITYSSIATAYGDTVEYHEDTMRRMLRISPHLELTEARKRMALLPSRSEVFFPSEEFWVPLAVVNQNIHILPGVPRIFQQLLTDFRPQFETLASGQKFHRKLVGTMWAESKIAKILRDAQEELGERAKIGSYPKWNNSKVNVVISFVGKDEGLLEEYAKKIALLVDGFEITEEHDA